MSDEYLDAMTDDFNKVLDSLKRELTAIRTGRASPSLLDNVSVMVASYGTAMPLNQLATISTPDARLLVVNPWDKGTIHDIEKGIMAAGLGLNPSSDGQVVRVPIPPLTGERRQEMVKLVWKIVEDNRVKARRVRKDYNDIFKDLQDEKEITEDGLRKYLDKVQEATDQAIKDLEKIGAAKEKEVMEV